MPPWRNFSTSARTRPVRAALRLQPFVQMLLHAVERERRDGAGLGPDGQAPLGIVRKLVLKPLADIALFVV